MRMRQVHLDRKLSATARLPKRSTIIESPAGRSVRPSDVLQLQKSQEASQPHQHHQYPYDDQPQAISAQQGKSPNLAPSNPAFFQQQQQSGRPNMSLDTQAGGQSHSIRPAFARNNTEVMIVEDQSQPGSPANGDERQGMLDLPPAEDSITLADIGPLIEAAQAREQQRSLPRLSSIPCIAELSTTELAIIKYAAVLALIRSPLKEHVDNELVEMVEGKKASFWKNLLGRGDKKPQKKKIGTSFLPSGHGNLMLNVILQGPLKFH